jgi:multidrug efflux pump subunit AcrA (membrane-fusion protein)
MRKVEVTRTEGAETLLSGGVQAGETVVVDGASRLLPGSRVAAKPAESAS